MAIVFVPFYVRFLGVESYGLLGFMLSIQGLLALLDFGVSYAATRELARHKQDGRAQDILRSYEVVYWVVAVLLGSLIVIAAPWISEWTNYSSLSREEANASVRMFGLALGLLWPSTLYNGCLAGLERQVVLNALNAALSTARGGGAVLVLWLWSPSLEAMFGWQALVNLVGSVWFREQVWRVVGYRNSAVFKVEVLKNTLRYATGVSGILVMLTILSQLDKLFLTRFLPLKEFGYYSVATTVSSVFSYLATPVTVALFPRFVKSLESGDQSQTERLYHAGAQLLALAVIPIAVLLVFFSPEILLVWTRDHTLVQNVAPILVMLATASGINALVQLSYSLQAAAGWNRLVFYIHLVSVLAIVPIFVIVIPEYGAFGAAATWIAMYFFHLVIGPLFMHKRILRHQYGRWLLQDIGLPALVCVMTIGFIRYVSNGVTGVGETFLVLTLAWTMGAGIQLAVSRELHSTLARLWTLRHA